jgi:uncharacterized protein YdeI (YjbR/CyaY-like superfamily)
MSSEARRMAAMTLGNKTARMSRDIYPMPDDIRMRLEGDGLMTAYRERPMYQQNDYIGWIGRAKRPETREKRLTQMLRELAGGTVYMGMAWGRATTGSGR